MSLPFAIRRAIARELSAERADLRVRHRAAGARGERDEGVLNVALAHPRPANERLATHCPQVHARRRRVRECGVEDGSEHGSDDPTAGPREATDARSRHAIGTES